jgi:hypothetical protein
VNGSKGLRGNQRDEGIRGIKEEEGKEIRGMKRKSEGRMKARAALFPRKERERENDRARERESERARERESACE